MKLSYYLLESPLKNGGILLVNTLQATYMLLDKDMKNIFFEFKNTLQFNRLNSDLKQALIELSMLIPNDMDEYTSIVNGFRTFHSQGDTTLHLTISTTLGCNLKCGYCFEKDKKNINIKEDEDSIFHFIKNNIEHKEHLSISWFGGEPLLNLKSIETLSQKIIRLSTFQGLSYSADITTNGVYMTEKNAKVLQKSLVSSVQITMDGDQEIHDKMRPKLNNKGSYEDVLKGLIISNKYFQTLLRINLNEKNIASVERLLYILADLKLFNIQLGFAPIVSDEVIEEDTHPPFTIESFAKAEVHLSKVAKKLGFSISAKLSQNREKVSCQVLNPNYYIIEPNGYINKCVDFIGMPMHSIAQLNQGRLQASQNEMIWKAYDTFTLYQPKEDDDCNVCKYLPLCLGGCPKERLEGKNKKQYICTPLRFNLIEMLKLELDVE